MAGHGGAVTACSWSFNSRHLATAGADGSVMLWDAESGAPLLKLPVKAGSLSTCSVSPNSLYVACGSISGVFVYLCVCVQVCMCVSVGGMFV